MNGRIDLPAVQQAAHAVPTSRVDFDRHVVSILGLPFDAIGVAQAVQRIRDDAFAGRRCVVSTPNLNFAIAARTDAAFRDTVLRSDLSLVDGMPLVWIARLLGLPIRERVSGADVFEALQAHAGPPLGVYLFGGLPGVAERACERINQRGGGMRCVGFETPGFGSIESMSEAAMIGRINDSGAHFVVLSLGAKKGQAWIEHNAPRLTAPVLSHLGAVLNFAAGSLQRAPAWMQSCGLEWLWRIKEEPGLWRRYGSDGLRAAQLLPTRVLPDALASRSTRQVSGDVPPRLERHAAANGVTLALHGAWRDDDLPALCSVLKQLADGEAGPVSIDLTAAETLDSAVIGTLLLASGWFRSRAGFDVVGASDRMRTAFRRQLVEQTLLRIA